MENHDWTAPKSQQKPAQKGQNGYAATLKMWVCILLFCMGMVGLLSSIFGLYYIFFVPSHFISLGLSIVVTIVSAILFYFIINDRFDRSKRAYISTIVFGLLVLCPALFFNNDLLLKIVPNLMK